VSQPARPQWLRWAERLQAIAQTGLTYARDPYDRDRYTELRGLAVEIVAAHVPAPAEEVAVAFASGTRYPTPMMDVRAVVVQDDRVLLVREASVGLWTFPGGWADVGCSPSEVAAKETLEESGYVVRPMRLLALLDKARQGQPPSLDYVWKAFFLCALESGDARTSHETNAVGFFDVNALPELDAGRTTKRQVLRMLALAADPSLPPDID
jgi:ADP-ribose pyrophosphatase YjhB (NUDIX family)